MLGHLGVAEIKQNKKINTKYLLRWYNWLAEQGIILKN
jgi:hypothetical protein